MEEALRIFFFFFWFFQSREYTWHMKSDYIGEDSNKLRLQNFPNYRRNRGIIKLNENKRVHLMILLIWLQEKLLPSSWEKWKIFEFQQGTSDGFSKLEVYIIRRVGEKYIYICRRSHVFAELKVKNAFTHVIKLVDKLNITLIKYEISYILT